MVAVLSQTLERKFESLTQICCYLLVLAIFVERSRMCSRHLLIRVKFFSSGKHKLVDLVVKADRFGAVGS